MHNLGVKKIFSHKNEVQVCIYFIPPPPPQGGGEILPKGHLGEKYEKVQRKEEEKKKN
jgi:hypothetical protein